jgi:hypothetical protein
MENKVTDVKHVTDYITHESRKNLIADIDAALEDSPAGTFDTLKDQYTRTTRDVLVALASGFPDHSLWHDDLVNFISLADIEFGLVAEPETNGKTTAKGKRKR